MNQSQNYSLSATMNEKEIAPLNLENQLHQISDNQTFVNGTNNINITEHETIKFEWLTLGSGAQINREALIEPCSVTQSVVVGCMAGFNSDPKKFVNQNKHLPIVAYQNIEEIKNQLDQYSSYIFYYPTVPNQQRDTNSIELLKYFKNSIMLIEKPSHNKASDARNFNQILSNNNISVNRVLVGMHNSLHPNTNQLMKLVEQYKDQISSISCKFNYPKNPHDQGAFRCYDLLTGGVMLDLGVYVFQSLKQIGQILDYDLHKFDQNNKNIYIKKNPFYIDFEVIANLQYGDLKVHLETKMNPGANHTEEIIILLKNGDKLVQNQFAHPHCSTGVFIEHFNGSVSQFVESNCKKSSYTYQVEYCQEVLNDLIINGENKMQQIIESHSLKNQIYLLDFIDILKANFTQTND